MGISWKEAMLRNTYFKQDSYKKFGVKFDLPSEYEQFRIKRGLLPRPKKYLVD